MNGIGTWSWHALTEVGNLQHFEEFCFGIDSLAADFLLSFLYKPLRTWKDTQILFVVFGLEVFIPQD